MSRTVKLSEDEVLALMEGIANGSVATDGGVSPGGEVRKFEFGANGMHQIGELHALQTLNERLARGLRQVFQKLLRFQPRIQAEPIEPKPFDHYLATIGSNFLSLNVVRMIPLRGNALVVLPAELISVLVDAFFGGKGQVRQSRQSEFTPTEERIIHRLLEDMLTALGAAWEDIMGIRFSLLSSESHLHFANFVEGEEVVIATRFSVQIPGSGAFKVDILYPMQALKPLVPLLSSRIQSDHGPRNPFWQARLQEALLDIELPLRSILAEPSVTIGDLMTLAPGDILPIQVPEHVQLLIDRTKLADGTLGESNGTAAIQITSFRLPGAKPVQG